MGRTGSKVDGAQRAWGCSPGGPCSTQKHEEEPRVDSAGFSSFLTRLVTVFCFVTVLSSSPAL